MISASNSSDLNSLNPLNQSEKTISNDKDNLFVKHFTWQVSDKINGAWHRFKDCLREPTELGKRIRALARDGYQDKDQAALIEAFASKEYPQLIFFISRSMHTLNDRQLNEFVKELFIAHGIENAPSLIRKLKGLFSLQKIEGMIRTDCPLFSSTIATVNKMTEINKNARKGDTVVFQKSLRAVALTYLHQGIDFLLNMLVYLLRLKQFLPGEQSEYFDPYTRDLAYQNFIGNLVIFSGWLMSLSLMTGSVVLGGLILGSGLVSILACVYAYKKYFKPPPEEVSGSTNLTMLDQKGQLPQVFGRDEEVRSLVDALCSNNETTRRHPILTGQTRVGKTEIVKGLVHYLNSDDVVPELKGKRVLHINSAELNSEGALNKIIQEVQTHESEYIFFFDEFHSIFNDSKTSLKNRFKTLLDPGKNGLKYCIFATTKKEFTETIFREDAILARLSEIVVNPLHEGEIFPVLMKMVKRDAPDLVVDLEAIKAFANLHKDYNEYRECSQPFTSKIMLSQVLAQVRNDKCGEKENTLRKLKDEKIAIESSEENYGATTFLFSEEGVKRNGEIDAINVQIKQLEDEIAESKRKTSKFRKVVIGCNQLREKIEDKAARFSVRPSEGELQEFILEYYYLQTAFHKKIERYRQIYPQCVVSLDRVQQHMQEELAKKSP